VPDHWAKRPGGRKENQEESMASWTQIRRAHYAWHSLSSITSSSLASIIFSSPRGTCLALAYRALTDNMSGKEGEREEHSRIIHGLFPPLWSLQLKLLPHTLINHYCDDGVALEEGDFLAVCVPVHYVNLEFARELQKGGGGGGKAGTRLAEVRGTDRICRTRET